MAQRNAAPQVNPLLYNVQYGIQTTGGDIHYKEKQRAQSEWFPCWCIKKGKRGDYLMESYFSFTHFGPLNEA